MTAERPDARSTARRVGRLMVKLICAGVFTGLLLELGLRIVGFRPVMSMTATLAPNDLHAYPGIADAQRRGWLPRPNERRRIEPLPDGSPGSVEIRRNRLSLREDAETPLEAPADVARVLCLGDSHTDGVCDNADSYPHQLQRLWNDGASRPAADPRSDDDRPAPARPFDLNTQIEVLNAGWATSSPYQQLWAFEQVYWRLRPKLVCIGFYAGNDLVDLMRSADTVHLERNDDRFVHAEPNRAHDSTQATHSTWESVKSPFRKYSATYAALTQVRWLRGAVLDAAGDTYRNRLEQAHRAHPGAVWQDLNQAYYFRHHPDQWTDALAQQRFILERYVALSRRDTFALMLAVIPAMRQIHSDTDEQAFAASIATLELESADVAADERACDAVVDMARELGISCVDLRTPLRRARLAQPMTPLYYRVDQHLNVAGNQVVATALQESLAN